MLVAGVVAVLLRYWGLDYFNNLFQIKSGFNASLLLVNVLGSFLIGIAYVIKSKSPESSDWVYVIFMVGFLGAFTTFSSYSLELLRSVLDKNYALALASFASHNILGFLFCFAGYWLTQRFYNIV